MSKRAAFVSGGVAVGLCVFLAACGSPDESATGGTPVPAASSTAPAPPATATWSVANGARLAPYSRVEVSVDGGSLTTLIVTDGAGTALPTTAGATGALAPGQQFTAQVTMRDADGRSSRTETRLFSTEAVTQELSATVSPAAGSTVGVGEPIQVTLSRPATTKAQRAAVEGRLTVRTSRRTAPANWYWLSDTRLAYRPATYWPGDTRVTFTAKLAGVQTDAETWGVADTTTSFTIGRSQVLKIDDTTHQMQVLRDGQLIRTVPVSMGQHIGTWTTRSGIKTIMSIESSVRMNSATVGITGADAYDEVVPYAMRLTWSGEYIHGAPWSEWAQGSTDVSHGCVNVSLANAQWLYGNSMVGDVVETVGTDRAMETDGNGTGGVWNIPYATWKTGSAL